MRTLEVCDEMAQVSKGRLWNYVRNELSAMFVPAPLAILLVVAGIYLDHLFWPSVACASLGVLFGVTVDRWWSEADTMRDAAKAHAPPEHKGSFRWLMVYIPTSFIVMAWLMMLGLCSLLGPMDPSRHELLRGGILICVFITARYLVQAVAFGARFRRETASQSLDEQGEGNDGNDER